jgi:hypothetical protein
MAHKVIGAWVAVLSWAITYRGWYQLPYSPGMPGHGPLLYVNYKRTD